jgi:effector-binding domain-containing protein
MRALMYTLLAALILVALVVGGWYAFIRSVETPPHELLRKDGPFEVRSYPALLAAEVERRGPRQRAVERGFGPLAGYIFAKKRSGEKVAMTAPVTQTRAAGETWRVRFIMPQKYTKASLPKPGDEDVEIVEIPPRTVGAVRFSGRADDDMFETQEAELQRWLKAQGYTVTGTATLAYYDDPFVPGPLRRNEVIVPVEGPDGP